VTEERARSGADRVDSSSARRNRGDVPAFSSFDRRNYPAVRPPEGYGAWSASYEETIKEDMDLRLLERVGTVRWDRVERAADLGCGTGRAGTWFRAHGVREIHGVDLTPEMLERARARGVYQRLVLAEVGDVPCVRRGRGR
jgi:SAM-dependent methyltransferase